MSVAKALAFKEQNFTVSLVTQDSLEEVAQWCKGKIKDDHEALMTPLHGYPKYIELVIDWKVVRASIGDYIVKLDKSYMVLSAPIFNLFFEMN
ncbi:hypothetical protein SEA_BENITOANTONIO_70 [Arthrobacter phage BenitoAntonio]|uniref:Uncharacterized protein n=2 Tax=Mudcatvirus TaxID=1982088 RepID=A0AAE7SJZ5_9CAUD|nr:hypothetical protein FDH65_gp73 [Arthrobacter phage Circum]YP_010666750.1 hypothetical protein PQB81_gp071 [Arthrobacter phage Kardesai]UYL87333.1 hypothetical protein SEA_BENITOANTONIO_70 [Arthrobacter phage BenitoAntonio]WBF79115.1 hypothetical protein SEA_HANKLY_71 [Arthrobacter phage Hankly]ALY08757.1 hypothetical protein CIRCUM_73 [Arthrobacter phage Circum]QXO12978.1 hypothetical protein SEA_KARDESAI_71 [Arthrobacter phage Kardesai]